MKLFVTDYDNTLYINDVEIKETIKDLLALQKRDVKIVIATGRCITSIKDEIEKHHIPFDYLSCADGSLIYDKNYKLIKEYAMKKDIIDELNYLTKGVNYEKVQISYPDGYSNTLDLTKSISSINLVINKENYNTALIEKFNYLKEHYPHYNYVFYLHDPTYYLCIKKKNVSKAKSIYYLAKLLKIKKKDIYVIGDSDNDLEMIKEFNGVTVSNGTEKIKEVSKKMYNKISDYINEI